jgi:hypothetical protein
MGIPSSERSCAVGTVAVIDWSRDGLVDRKRRRAGGAGMNRNDPANAEEDALDV